MIMAMSQCPVCQTAYVESEIERCSVCQWELKPYPFLMGLIPEVSNQEKAKLEWARKSWAASKLQLQQVNQFQLQLKQAKQKEVRLQLQLEQVEQEQERLLADLDQVNQQQARLQAQLEQNTSPEPVFQQANRREFNFQVVTINARGQQTNSRSNKAECFSENLENDVSLEIVSIAGGAFWMGSPDDEEGRDANEEPQHQVTILPFWIGKFPVTQDQWQAIAALPRIERSLNPAPSNFKGADLPVEQVSWHDAVEFCARLAQKTGRDYRLPSEAEWEYACRATKTTPFHFGKTMTLKYADEIAMLKAQATTPFHFGETITPEIANYDGNYTYSSGPRGNYRQRTTPIGSFQVANAFGLYDMHGNVWEWCADPWHENYRGAPTDGSVWKSGGNDSYRLLRGGAWYCLPSLCRVAQRHWNHPDNGGSGIGFRVVCSSATL